MSGPFDPGNGLADQEPLEDLLDPFEESFDPFRPGSGDLFDGLHEPDLASPVLEPSPEWHPGGPEIGPDFLDLVEASVLEESGPSSQPIDLLDELEQSIESSPAEPTLGAGDLHLGEDGRKPHYEFPDRGDFQNDLFKESPGQQSPGHDVRAPAPAMGRPPLRKEGFRVEHHPPVKAWRPRGSAGVRPAAAGPAKKEQEKDFQVCPKTDEQVARAECQGCRHFKEDACAWREQEDVSLEG